MEFVAGFIDDNEPSMKLVSSGVSDSSTKVPKVLKFFVKKATRSKELIFSIHQRNVNEHTFLVFQNQL